MPRWRFTSPSVCPGNTAVSGCQGSNERLRRPWHPSPPALCCRYGRQTVKPLPPTYKFCSISALIGLYTKLGSDPTTHSDHSHPIAPNLLQRNFSFDRPDQAWVGDITYIPTGEGWLYLAIVKDLCTRKIVGYAFSDKIDTRLTLAALDMAYRRRKPARSLIFHSDRGVQYAAWAYRERLEAYGIRQSMSRRGDPYDNAVAENFFSCLKCELVHLKHYPTRAAAQDDVFVYLDAFYNTIRPHSALGWRSPASFEAELAASAA